MREIQVDKIIKTVKDLFIDANYAFSLKNVRKILVFLNQHLMASC